MSATEGHEASGAGPRGESRSAATWVLWWYLLLGLVGAVLVVVGTGALGGGASQPLRVAGYIAVFSVLLVGPAAWGAAKIASTRDRAAATVQRLDALVGATRALADQLALSDDARRVLNRFAERTLLREAIEEDIAAGDWDAAMVLVKELAERFGYRSDAEEFRERIEHARYETVQRRVDEGVARLDELIVQRRWEQAQAEAARIARLYPDSHRAEGLRHRVEHARQLYKADLERRFLEAASTDGRVDEAMSLLTELDAYLGESEAEPYREVARGVIGKARENLGAQFKIAVTDRHWRRAAEIGERIIEQFPNSRMAHEVRGMLDTIRGRVGGAPARVGQQSA